MWSWLLSRWPYPNWNKNEWGNKKRCFLQKGLSRTVSTVISHRSLQMRINLCHSYREKEKQKWNSTHRVYCTVYFGYWPKALNAGAVVGNEVHDSQVQNLHTKVSLQPRWLHNRQPTIPSTPPQKALKAQRLTEDWLEQPKFWSVRWKVHFGNPELCHNIHSLNKYLLNIEVGTAIATAKDKVSSE